MLLQSQDTKSALFVTGSDNANDLDSDTIQLEEDETLGGSGEMTDEAESAVVKRNETFWGRIVAFLESQRKKYGHEFTSLQWEPCVFPLRCAFLEY